MLGELIPCGGGIPIQLRKTSLVIGRRPECDVTIPSGSVSGRHCELRFADGFWQVRDLDSKNGIGVNGVRCQEQRLEPKDRLSIGRVRFRISYSTASDSTRSDSTSSADDLAMQFLLGDDAPAAATASVAASTVKSEPQNSQPSQSGSLPNARRPPAAQPKTSSPAKSPSREKTAARPQRPRSTQKTDAPPRVAKKSGKRFLGKLVPCGGGDPIPLLESPLLIGRASGSDIRLKQPSVSSRHCKLEYRDGFWYVTDLSSRNGIRVDGVSTESSHLLPEAILAVARFRLQIHYTPPEDAIPPDDDILSVSLLEKAGLSRSLKEDETPNWLVEDEDSSPKPRYEIKDSDSADPV